MSRSATPSFFFSRLAAAGVAIALLAGCSGGESQRLAQMQRFAGAAGAKSSESLALQNAIAAVESQGGLASQLTPAELPNSQNAAAMLAEVFDDPLRKALDKPLERFLDRDRLHFEAAELLQIQTIFDGHASRIEQTQAAASAPAAQFDVAPELGFYASTAYLADAAIACRFDLLAAGMRLSIGDASNDEAGDAVADLQRAARWIGWLASESRLEPRLLAARLRSEWLLVVEAIAEHPSASLSDYEHLRAVLVGWLDNWPNESRAIVGDRAAAIHAYEAIREGLLNEVAAPEELFRLAEYGVSTDRPIPPERLEQDETIYLRAIARLLPLLKRPFHERVAEHRNVAALLEGTDRAPLAAELFLPALPTSLETLAIDRAACEVWAIALSSAGGMRLPEYRTSSHTGETYEIERMPRSLTVKAGDPMIRNPFSLLRVQ